jgi:hypothetical protein
VNQVGRLITTYSMGFPADTLAQLANGNPHFQSPKVDRFKVVAPCRETYRFPSAQRAAETMVLMRIRPNQSLTRPVTATTVGRLGESANCQTCALRARMLQTKTLWRSSVRGNLPLPEQNQRKGTSPPSDGSIHVATVNHWQVQMPVLSSRL